MSKYYLGIDTSCYTTSLAILDENGSLLGDYRRMLDVESGKIGLRQSEGFFKHVNNLPELYADLVNEWDPSCIEAIGVSSQPRYLEDSYMPVFTAGVHFAKTIGLTLGKQVFSFSHQEGHIEASKWSSHFNEDSFIALHISGGTTEILKVKRDGIRYRSDILGGAKDISAGKLIDRVGVYMGASFPAGKVLDEQIEFQPKQKWGYPTSVKEGWINFSGLENYAKKQFEANQSVSKTAEGLFEAIAKSIKKATDYICEETGVKTIVYGGGVTSSQYIQAYLRHHNRQKIQMVFSTPLYAVDNAVGIAELCRQSFQVKVSNNQL